MVAAYSALCSSAETYEEREEEVVGRERTETVLGALGVGGSVCLCKKASRPPEDR